MILISLAILSLIPLWQWFSPSVPITHDILSHIYRLASFNTSLFQGNLIPRWAGNLNLGYGHPVLMFLYPLSGYLGSFFTLSNLSFVDSVKLTFFCSAVFSAWGMYLAIKSLTSNRQAGIIASLFYIFAPYHLVNFNVRAALGEVLALAIFPWLFWRLQLLIKNQDIKNIYLTAILTSLLILAHNATAILGFIFIGLLFIFKFTSPKRLVKPLLAITLGFFLSAFFWLPSLVEGKYTLRQQLTNTNTYISNYPSFKELIYSHWGFGLTSHQGQSAGFNLQIGYLHWLVAVIGTIFCFRENKFQSILIAATISFWLSLFFILPVSGFLIDKLPFIKNFQFPWRFLNLVVIATSIQAGLIFSRIKLKYSVVFFVAFFLILLSFPGWRIQDYYSLPTDNQAFMQLSDNSSALNFTTPTTDTGESSPIWSVRWQESWPPAQVQVIEGKAEIKIDTWEFESHQYQVQAQTKTKILDSTLYFPGWQVFIDDHQVPLEGIYFQDPNHRGLINFNIPQGEHIIKVIFTETKVRQLANYLSLATLSIMSIYLVIKLWFKK